MTASSIQQNQIPNEPELMDLLNLFKRDILLSLNSHHVGTIESFDPLKQTASVTIAYKKTYFKPNALTGGYDPVLVDYPTLVDCPVFVLGGGTAAITFPIKKGDECIIAFNDRSLDNWFAGATSGAVSTPRLHSISDGMVFVGLRSMAKVITSYDPDNLQLRQGASSRFTLGDNLMEIAFGNQKVYANASKAALQSQNAIVAANASTQKINIQNQTQNLNTILQDLVTKINALNAQLQILVTQTSIITVAVPALGTSGPPNNAAAITPVGVQIGSIITQLTTIGTNLGALLE